MGNDWFVLLKPERVVDDATRVAQVNTVPSKPANPTAIQQISEKVVTPRVFENIRLEREYRELDARLERTLKVR